MHQISVSVTPEQAEALEAHFCEEYQEHWMLYQNEPQHTQELRGYFDQKTEAAEHYAALREVFPDLPAESATATLEDKDWKEAYKLHFKAWSDRGLHFVPVWERDAYPLPEGEEIILLDPGMAFGTGNHETTRLCLRRVLDAREAWGATVGEKQVIDAGCGSGILAIAAAKAGFGSIHAFDNDPDSVRISLDNTELCDVADQVEFAWQGLEEGLADRKADLVLANILAPVLLNHAKLLLNAVAPGGRIALSGILAKEIDQVTADFSATAQRAWGEKIEADQRVDGEWADLLFTRPRRPIVTTI